MQFSTSTINLEEHINNEGYVWVETKTSILMLLLDQMVRWGVFFLYKWGYISYNWLFIIQLILIPILIFFINSRRVNSIKNKIRGKITKVMIGSESFSGFYVFLSFALSCISIPVLRNIFSINNTNAFVEWFFIILLFLVYYIYNIIILTQSHSTKAKRVYFYPNKDSKIPVHVKLEEFQRLNGKKLARKESQDEDEIYFSDNVDINDIQIVEIESEMQNMLSRSESYIIESVFIGALTFSGFLTLISSDKIQENIDSLKNISNQIYEISNNVIGLNLDESLILFDNLINGWGLFALVSLESLISSTFFILVLATRIRFTTQIEKLKKLIDLVKSFNHKEEEIYLLNLQGTPNLEKRLSYLNEKVSLLVNDSSEILIRIKPLFTYMSLFRNLGIYSFYLIILTSGFFFSPKASAVIFGLLIMSYIARITFIKISNNKVDKIIKKYSRKRKNI